MAIVNAYVKFKGNAEEAMKFYKNALGGEFIATLRHGDNPSVSNGNQDKIAFMVLALDNETTIMASDVIDSDGESLREGNNVYLYINQKDKNAVDEVFEKLKVGGHVVSSPAATPWGGYFCELIDPFGVSWIINYQQDLGPLSRRP